MRRISQRWSNWYQNWLTQNPTTEESASPHLNAVVIGSGYGGCAAAAQLAKQGYHVTIIERGSEYLPGDFPNDTSTAPGHFRATAGPKITGLANGVFDLRVGPGVTSLVGNGLGGGSLINAGVMMRPDIDIFAQSHWPEAIRSAPHKLDTYLDVASEKLQAQPVSPDSNFLKSDALDRMGKQLDAQAIPVVSTINQKVCTNCGDCCSGCNVDGAKITLVRSYLNELVEPAEPAHGEKAQLPALLISSATVYSLRQVGMRDHLDNDGVLGEEGQPWILRLVPTERIGDHRSLREAARLSSAPGSSSSSSGDGVDVYADLVVVAAGTFGSTELLQRSRSIAGGSLQLSPALGSRFSGNGDSLAFSSNEEQRVNAIGLGAESWREKHVGYSAVGPTISRVIDLRRKKGSKIQSKPDGCLPKANSTPAEADLLPIEERLVVQDGAIPGAIAAGAVSMLSYAMLIAQIGERRWRFPRKKDSDHLSITGWTESEPDSIGQTTQVLLTMGHDESKGRLVWDERRNQSFPFWLDPQKLPTYVHRRAALSAAAQHSESVWVPNLLEEPLPAGIREILGGPSIPTFMTTVHPLGGCVMGDEPIDSVVSSTLQVWKVNPEEPETAQVYSNLFVCDGSIVPTSLGCNPSLTITALVERALSTVNLAEASHHIGDRADTLMPIDASPDYQPVALSRKSQPKLAAFLEERLVARSLTVEPELGRALGSVSLSSDLNLRLNSEDWLAMWGDHQHQFSVDGVVRFARTAEDSTGEQWIEYRVDPKESTAKLFAPDKHYQRYTRFVDLVGGTFRIAGAIRAMVSVWARRRGDLGYGRDKWRKIAVGIRPFLSWGWSAGEVRRMRYVLSLEPLSADHPKLRIVGTKRVAAAPSVGRVIKWRYQLRRAMKQGASIADTPVFPRDTLVEQASHLNVKLFSFADVKCRKPLAETRYEMDFADLTERLPVRLSGGGDLPTAMALISEYSSIFSRYLLKTALFDFRLPKYSGRQLLDVAADYETQLRIDGQHVSPCCHLLDVEHGKSSDDPATLERENVQLRLWHYARPDSEGGKATVRRGTWHGVKVVKAKSVLLVHAFAQSGYSYTLKSVEENLAEHLYKQGYEVWILEHRLSTRQPVHSEPSTLDQIARYDIPKAVDKIISVVGEQHADSGAFDIESEKLQIFAFGQCLGAASVSMSLLSGAISHDVSVEAGASLPRKLPKLAGFISSQTHPHCVAQPIVRAKYWLPAVLRDVLQTETIPLAARSASPSFVETMVDRLFSSLPIPKEERCPTRHASDHEDDCATCRRIRYIEAPLFKHKNLSDKTHAELPLLFGDANVRVFSHASKCAEAERLVTEDAENTYVTDANFRTYAGLPVVYLHGAENELFSAESAVKSARLYSATQPYWAQLSSATTNTDCPAHMVEGYGHVDVIIGKSAATDVFGVVSKSFCSWFDTDSEEVQDDLSRSRTTNSALVGLRIPQFGPLMGAVQMVDGKAEVSVAFGIDDRFSDSQIETTNPPSTWAFVRSRVKDPAGNPGAGGWSDLTLVEVELFSPANSATGTTKGVRVARGTHQLGDPRADYEIQCGSLHVLLGLSRSYGSNAEHVALLADGQLDLSPELNASVDTLFVKLGQKLDRFQSQSGPLRSTQSKQRLYSETIDSSVARLDSRSIAAFGGLPEDPVEVVMGVASCRYPGFRFEHHRVDRWISNAAPDLHYAVLLGDQIYADATAGFADEFSPVERYFKKHHFALRRQRAGAAAPNFGDWLATLPAFMIPDDHEFQDAYPDGPPLAAVESARLQTANAPIASAARTALSAYQQQQMNSCKVEKAKGVWEFTSPPVRMLLLDTRSHRHWKAGEANLTLLADEQWSYLEEWLSAEDAGKYLNVISTGSVVLPGLVPDCNPSNPGRLDNFQASPGERQRLLDLLRTKSEAEGQPFKFLLLSGDYHLAGAFSLSIESKVVGAAIVSPPLYSPMPSIDASFSSINVDEDLPGGWEMSPIGEGMWKGNGLARLGLRRVGNVNGEYELVYSGKLWAPDTFRVPEEAPEFKVSTII